MDLDVWLGFLSQRHLLESWKDAPREEVQADFDLTLEYEAWLITLVASYQCLWTAQIFGGGEHWEDPMWMNWYNMGFVIPQILYVIPMCGFCGVRYNRPSLLILYGLINLFLMIPLEVYWVPDLLKFWARLFRTYNHYAHSDIWAVGTGRDFHDYTPLNDGLWILYHTFLIAIIPIAVFVNVFCAYYAFKLSHKMVADQKISDEAKLLEL